MENYIMIEGNKIALSEETVNEMKTKFGMSWKPDEDVIESINAVLETMSEIRVSYLKPEAEALKILLFAKAWIDEFDNQGNRGKYKMKYRRDNSQFEEKILISQEQSRAGLFDAYFSTKDKVRECIRWMKAYGIMDRNTRVRT